MKMVINRAIPVAKKTALVQIFQSPVGALNSSKVWQNDARYRAFFSWMDNFFQSPFSFSRRAYIDNIKSLFGRKKSNRWNYQNFGCVFLETDGWHRIIGTVNVDGQSVATVADNFTLANFLGVRKSTGTGWCQRSRPPQRQSKQSQSHCVYCTCLDSISN